MLLGRDGSDDTANWLLSATELIRPCAKILEDMRRCVSVGNPRVEEKLGDETQALRRAIVKAPSTVVQPVHVDLMVHLSKPPHDSFAAKPEAYLASNKPVG